MPTDTLLRLIMSWESEDTHRGALVRALKSDHLHDPVLQAQRLAMLGLKAERQFLADGHPAH
ncbi:hypothetical protein AB0K86_06150 [Streptomyces clavifer]|uniref:hypothetical protein n=1 Tax=Streptomyces TaxID=1883 RepID=UPI00070A8363|nr:MULTISPECIES: hypothetical protein [unclassified Streptomyces]KQX77631.1 hypothetical protein ASD26_15475 [Streptomyces sp. Root1319]